MPATRTGATFMLAGQTLAPSAAVSARMEQHQEDEARSDNAMQRRPWRKCYNDCGTVDHSTED